MSPSFVMRTACVIGVATAVAPRSAQAYAEVDAFSLQAASGGGGGRHFTGSPVDGYTCTACHEGGEVPAIRVLGLPLAGYKPGGLYEITIDWSDSIEHLAAAVELTDMQGRRAGRLRLPAADEAQDPELCEATLSLGAEVVRVPPADAADQDEHCGNDKDALPVDCRQVVHVRSCGSQRLRFLWNAPSGDFGQIWFSGSAIASDDDNSDRGDGVAEFSHVVPARNADGEVVSATAGCSVSRRPGGHSQLWLCALVLLGLRRSRRRAR